MPASYKLLWSALFLSGLVLMLVGINAIISLSNNTILVYSCLFIGGTLACIGIAIFWYGSSKTRNHITQENITQENIKRTEEQKAQNEILLKVADIQKIIDEIKKIDTYLIYEKKTDIFLKIENLHKEINRYSKRNLLKSDFINKINVRLSNSAQFALNYNQIFVQQRKKDYRHLWVKDNILLDDEQQTAIVTDEKNNLIVAGAGSGKTEVLITRIRYLVARVPDGILPNRILAIAYQNKDVKQIKRRLEKHGVFGVHVKTFHSLGLDILEKAGISKENLEDRERKELIRTIYGNELKNNSDFYDDFLTYAKSIHETSVQKDFADEVDSIQINKVLPYTALNNESVKSRAEKDIYHFLLTHKLNNQPIKVEYEKKLEIAVENEIQVKKPDFYLPDYDLYIEHWGLNKNGEVPKWFDQSTEEYVKNRK